MQAIGRQPQQALDGTPVHYERVIAKMVIPAGLPDSQQLLLVEKDSNDTLSTHEILPVRFSLLEEAEAA